MKESKFVSGRQAAARKHPAKTRPTFALQVVVIRRVIRRGTPGPNPSAARKFARHEVFAYAAATDFLETSDASLDGAVAPDAFLFDGRGWSGQHDGTEGMPRGTRRGVWPAVVLLVRRAEPDWPRSAWSTARCVSCRNTIIPPAPELTTAFEEGRCLKERQVIYT